MGTSFAMVPSHVEKSTLHSLFNITLCFLFCFGSKTCIDIQMDTKLKCVLSKGMPQDVYAEESV